LKGKEREVLGSTPPLEDEGESEEGFGASAPPLELMLDDEHDLDSSNDTTQPQPQPQPRTSETTARSETDGNDSRDGGDPSYEPRSSPRISRSTMTRRRESAFGGITGGSMDLPLYVP
jgi:hypothetical protein